MAMVMSLFFLSRMHLAKPQWASFHGTLLTPSRPISAFEFLGTDGKAFNHDSLSGKWTFFFFGFTHCGYLCPTTLAELAKMFHLLDQAKVKPLPELVMFSLDPERDSLAVLANYVHSFDAHFKGALGSPESIQKLTHELGLAYVKLDKPMGKNANEDDIEHSGTLILLDPNGQIRAFFTSPQQAEALRDDYLMLIS